MAKLQIDTTVPTDIKLTRELNAPRRLVMKALTTPELLKQWQGGDRSQVLSVEMDARVGGTYRTRYRAENGFEFSFSGVIKELTDSRIVFTQHFNDDPNSALITTTLIESDGRTTMTLVMTFATQEARDFVVGTGMAQGAGESYDHLERLLTTL